jgi:hypothetical protein
MKRASLDSTSPEGGNNVDIKQPSERVGVATLINEITTNQYQKTLTRRTTAATLLSIPKPSNSTL